MILSNLIAEKSSTYLSSQIFKKLNKENLKEIAMLALNFHDEGNLTYQTPHKTAQKLLMTLQYMLNRKRYVQDLTSSKFTEKRKLQESFK